MADRSKLYDKGDKNVPKKEAKSDEKKGEEKAVEKKAEGDGKEAEGEKIAEEGKEEGTDAFDLLKSMRERHRTERRDAHGNHKAMLDQMHKRHDKEIEDFHDKNMEGLKASPDVTAEEVAPEPPAEAAPEA